MNSDTKGRIAEAVAIAWLRLTGHRILARRWSAHRGSGMGEIDAVIQRGGCVAFVEIKHRRTRDAALWAVQPRQRRRIERAAGAFLALHPELARLEIRFDAVLLAPGHWPRHHKDAWRFGS